MATPTLKKETIQITLEKGSGTILVSRPDNTAKSIGLIHQFSYTGDAAMDLMQALATARRQLTAQIAANAAKPTASAAKPAVADANDEPVEGEQADDDATDADATNQADEPGADEAVEPSEEDEATPEPGAEWKYDDEVDALADSDPASAPRFDELSAPHDLQPVAEEDLDPQMLLLF